mgnify:CR=1 FL=1
MSTFKVDTLQSTTGGVTTLTNQSASKHFCNWNGQGTPAILESFNTASLTDVNVAEVTVVLTSAMSSANYGCTATSSGGDRNITYSRGSANTSSAIRTYTTDLSSSASEAPSNTTVAHGDLA